MILLDGDKRKIQMMKRGRKRLREELIKNLWHGSKLAMNSLTSLSSLKHHAES